MSKRRVQLVIVCEDLQQEVFARHFFIKRGFNRRTIRIQRPPTGKGSGEQGVRQQYPKEVRTYRRKRHHLTIKLAVVIDADPNFSVQQRQDQLDEALEADGQKIRLPDEQIAIFVPKRNIETWIHYLMGATVDEETTYPKLSHESECKPYVEKLVEEYVHRDCRKMHHHPCTLLVKSYRESFHKTRLLVEESI